MSLGNRIAWSLVVGASALACAPSPQYPSVFDESPQHPSDTITFLHLNDTYRVGALTGRGGLSRVVTVVKRLKSTGREVRVLHAGDFLHPSLESNHFNGLQMVHALNYIDSLAPVIVVPGNHEFDGGARGVGVALECSKFNWVADNVELKLDTILANDTTFANSIRKAIDDANMWPTNGCNTNESNKLEEHFTLLVGEWKVGTIGLTLYDSLEYDSLNSYGSIGSNYNEVAQSVIDKFESDSTTILDLVIGLTHLPLEDDAKLSTLKKDYSKFQFIVGGHEHEKKHEFRDSIGRAEVMKGASNARVIWQIDVFFDSSGQLSVHTDSISLDSTIPPDSAYDADVEDKWRELLVEKIPRLDSLLGVVADGDTFDAREVTVRNQQSNWGSFVVDQMRTAFEGPDADFALINSGTFRIDDIITDTITYEDVARTFGFSTTLRHLEMTGEAFKNTLEAGFRGIEGGGEGFFPQVSGFRVCVNWKADPGERIERIQLRRDERWQDIESDKSYTIVVNNWLASGNDGYDFSSAQQGPTAGSELEDLVLRAIREKTANGDLVSAEYDARILAMPNC